MSLAPVWVWAMMAGSFLKVKYITACVGSSANAIHNVRVASLFSNSRLGPKFRFEMSTLSEEAEPTFHRSRCFIFMSISRPGMEVYEEESHDTVDENLQTTGAAL